MIDMTTDAGNRMLIPRVEAKDSLLWCEESDESDFAIHIVYYLNRPLFCGCQSNGTYFNRHRAVTNNRRVYATRGEPEEGQRRPQLRSLCPPVPRGQNSLEASGNFVTFPLHDATAFLCTTEPFMTYSEGMVILCYCLMSMLGQDTKPLSPNSLPLLSSPPPGPVLPSNSPSLPSSHPPPPPPSRRIAYFRDSQQPFVRLPHFLRQQHRTKTG